MSDKVSWSLGRISPVLVMQFAGTFAWLLVGAMARPGAAQEPVPAAPPPSFADLVPSEETVQPTGPVPSYYAGGGSAPTAPRVVTGFFDSIAESICGQPDPDSWRPLPFSTHLSEGWNEAWVPSPNGSGGAPRQGWINAADGNLYRLWFFTFAQAFNQGPKGNAYLGAYTIFLPFSRRLNLIEVAAFAPDGRSIEWAPLSKSGAARRGQRQSA